MKNVNSWMLTMVVALTACSQADAPPDSATATVVAVAPTASSAPLLSAQGYGPVRFGMTQDAAQRAAKASLDPSAPQDFACSSLRFASLPGVRFMVEQGIVTRADAEAGVANALGVAIGDRAAQVREKFPALLVTPHKYEMAGHYLTFDSDDKRAAVVMEDDGNHITKIRAGLQPAVAYVEGCL